jgi:hypothetical protein
MSALRLPRNLLDATMVLALTSALLYFLGARYDAGFHDAIGLPDLSRKAPHETMLTGFSVLWQFGKATLLLQWHPKLLVGSIAILAAITAAARYRPIALRLRDPALVVLALLTVGFLNHDIYASGRGAAEDFERAKVDLKGVVVHVKEASAAGAVSGSPTEVHGYLTLYSDGVYTIFDKQNKRWLLLNKDAVHKVVVSPAH